MLQNVNVISFCDVSKCDCHTGKKEKTNSIFEIMLGSILFVPFKEVFDYQRCHRQWLLLVSSSPMSWQPFKTLPNVLFLKINI